MNSHTSINIYFYSTDFGVDWPDAKKDYKYLNTAPLLLDHYVRHNANDLHSRLNWVKFSFGKKTQDQLVEEINSLGIDVLCFSMYSWNIEHILEISKNIKSRLNKKVLLLAGGPSVDVARPNSNFNLEHRDFDYTIYSHGERPFMDILNHHYMGKPLNVLTTKNCSWVDASGKIKKADFEFLKITNGSPYIDGKHLLLKIINDAEYSNTIWKLPYETSRGCPYSCSFCDWNGGLSNKVSKRRFTYKEELLLFQELELFLIYPADANVGMFKEDESIIEELAELNRKNGYKFKFVSMNFSKNKKDVVFRIIKKCLDARLFDEYKISAQDINEHILKNIDRPDIPWADHLTYIEEIKHSYPNIRVIVEIIKGLPGQTRDTWKEMLIELSKNNFRVFIHPFIVLPNAPVSYNKEWQETMKIKTESLGVIRHRGETTTSKCTSVISTYSYNKIDYAYFTLLELLYKYLEFDNRLAEFEYYASQLDSDPYLQKTLTVIESSLYDRNKLELFQRIFFKKRTNCI